MRSAPAPEISVHTQSSSSSSSSQFSRSHKLAREDAIEEGESGADPGPNLVKRRMTMPADTSGFRKTLSEEAKLGDEAAAELEQRLRNLISAFHNRTKRTKEKIAKPPTPSISDSEDGLPEEEDDLLKRLRQQLQTPGGSLFGGDGRRQSVVQRVRWSCFRKLRLFYNFLCCNYVLDADGNTYVSWLVIVAAVFLYNALVIPLRAVFPYQTKENVRLWQCFDLLADAVYVIDIIAFKSHRKFLREGFWIKDPRETRKSYFESFQFKVDLAALFPADLMVSLAYGNYPLLRVPRLLKLDTYWELFQRFDTVLESPHGARITKTLLYMIYMIHLNGCMYYALSKMEGLCTTTWTFCPAHQIGSAYIRCFYMATKTATSIGKNPKPENQMEYMYMTFAWLSGVFVSAILIGQIRDIIATATKHQSEYRAMTHAVASYLHRIGVPRKLQDKVKLWLSYTWEQQKTLDESKILDLLPDKMRTDVALDLHVETLSKVKLFQHCEVSFLRDLVVKLKSTIYLPGDYICRKGEVGREMFIIQSGKIHVIGGPSGTQILVTLGEGSVFGEIALLGIGGMNKRTADVRAAGFANLFVLHKDGLEEAIRDYPDSQEIIRKKAQKLMKENIKKAKAAAAAVESEGPSTGSDVASVFSEEVIIKTKREPKLIGAMMQMFPPESKMGLYLSRGSKGVMELSRDLLLSADLDLYSSYPPTPFVPGSPNHISLELDISIMSGDSSSSQLSPPPPSPPHLEHKGEAVFSPSLLRKIQNIQKGRSSTSTSTTSSTEELQKLYRDEEEEKGRVGGGERRPTLPPALSSSSGSEEEGEPRRIRKGSPPLHAVTPTPRRLSGPAIATTTSSDPESEKGDVVPSPLPSRARTCSLRSREGIPVGLRPPVYPILPGSYPVSSLSSSEESVEAVLEGRAGQRAKGGGMTGKMMTSRAAAVIASRFLTAAISRVPLRRQNRVEKSPEKEKKSTSFDSD